MMEERIPGTDVEVVEEPETEFVSVACDAEEGGAVPDPPAAADNCANPMEGGSARKTE